MKGKLYACEWLQDPIVGDYPGHEPRPIVASRTRALWVPEAGILLQWRHPAGDGLQVSRRDSFPPPTDVARVAHLEDKAVPYAVIQAARSFLRKEGHVQAQEAVLVQAMGRLVEGLKHHEGRVMSAVANAGLLR